MQKLNFQQFVPNKSAAYNAGYESFFIDRGQSDNPHSAGSENHNDWSDGFRAAQASTHETGVYYGCQIRTVIVEDGLPTEEVSENSIRQVQEKNDFRLSEFFLEYHNKEHGMGYDNFKVEKWLAAEKDILEKAYSNSVPASAFVYVY